MLHEDNPHMDVIVYVVNRNHLFSSPVLCDRNAIELHRYGARTWFPKTPKLVLIQALCGRRKFYMYVVVGVVALVLVVFL